MVKLRPLALGKPVETATAGEDEVAGEVVVLLDDVKERVDVLDVFVESVVEVDEPVRVSR